MSRTVAAENVFHAIACPTRRALLDVLAGGESNVSDLVASLAVTQSAVSQQLAVLKCAGLVTERAEGRFRLYRLRAEPLTEIETWLSRYRAQVERQLDALGRVLGAMPDEPKETPNHTLNRTKARKPLHEERPTGKTSRPKRRRRS